MERGGERGPAAFFLPTDNRHPQSSRALAPRARQKGDASGRAALEAGRAQLTQRRLADVADGRGVAVGGVLELLVIAPRAAVVLKDDRRACTCMLYMRYVCWCVLVCLLRMQGVCVCARCLWLCGGAAQGQWAVAKDWRGRDAQQGARCQRTEQRRRHIISPPAPFAHRSTARGTPAGRPRRRGRTSRRRSS